MLWVVDYCILTVKSFHIDHDLNSPLNSAACYDIYACCSYICGIVHRKTQYSFVSKILHLEWNYAILWTCSTCMQKVGRKKGEEAPSLVSQIFFRLRYLCFCLPDYMKPLLTQYWASFDNFLPLTLSWIVPRAALQASSCFNQKSKPLSVSQWTVLCSALKSETAVVAADLLI